MAGLDFLKGEFGPGEVHEVVEYVDDRVAEGLSISQREAVKDALAKAFGMVRDEDGDVQYPKER